MFNIQEREAMDQELLMTVVIVERELMVSSNLDHTPIRNYQKDKRPSQDLMVEYYVQDVLSPESSELSSSNKSKPSKKQRK